MKHHIARHLAALLIAALLLTPVALAEEAPVVDAPMTEAPAAEVSPEASAIIDASAEAVAEEAIEELPEAITAEAPPEAPADAAEPEQAEAEPEVAVEAVDAPVEVLDFIDVEPEEIELSFAASQSDMPEDVESVDPEGSDDAPVPNDISDFFYADGVVKGYRGKSHDVVIPDCFTEIGVGAFKGNTVIESVVVPASVTTIQYLAFSECTNLAKVVILGDVSEINNMTFNKCGKLVEVTLPDSITRIGNYAFFNCSQLEEIKLPESLTTIGNNAFQSCGKLRSVVFPEGVHSISEHAFEHCSSLTSAVFTAVYSVGDYAFKGTHLKEVVLNAPDSSVRGRIGREAFANCSRMKLLSLPEGVVSIDHMGFSNCDAIETFYFPVSLTDISYKAFWPENYTEKEVYSVCQSYATAFARSFFNNVTIHNETHIPVEVEGKPATCTETGYNAGVKCSICGKVFEGLEELPLLEHTPEIIPGREPTTWGSGLTDGERCSVCRKILKAQQTLPRIIDDTWNRGTTVTSGSSTPTAATRTQTRLIIYMPTTASQPSFPTIPAVSKSSKTTVYATRGTLYQLDLGGATGTNFNSSKMTVAAVSSKGLVSVSKAGKTKITFKVGGKKRTVVLTVKDPTVPTAIALNMAGTQPAQVGVPQALTVTLPEGTTSGIKWKSSNKKVATVSKTGVVTFKKKGKVTITATAVRGKKKAKVKFVVSK